MPSAAAKLLSAALSAFFALSASADPGPLGVSAPKESSPDVTLGIVYYTSPSPNESIIPDTVAALQKKLGKDHVRISWHTLPELYEAVRLGKVDVFLASSGFYRRLVLSGASHLATVASHDYPDPNHSDAAAFVVRSESPVQTLSEASGLVLGATSPTAFLGYQAGLGEVHRIGGNPDKFFRSTHFFGGGSGAAKMLDALRAGEVDLIVLRQCWLENHLRQHPEEAGFYRVLNPREGSAPCQRSTDLYPTWTIGTAPNIRPEVSKTVTAAVLDMPPTKDGFYWGIATDFRSVDELFRNLKIGPYQYLREWSLRRFVETYWALILTAVMMIAGLIFHSIRSESLVSKRTAELRKALKKQKAYERQVREANEKVSAMERIGIIGQLCSMFAHEMGQPLGAISLYAQGLRSLAKKDRASPEQIARAAAEIEEQASRASGIVERVRAYARAQSAGEEKTYSLSEAVTRALQNYRTSAGSSVKFIRHDTSSPMLAGDPLEMEIVALNLIKNAAEAVKGREGGEVTVAVGRRDRAVCLCVSDNGEPLPESLIQRLQDGIFDVRSTKHAGAGLGLRICRAIVEKNGGRMTFENKNEGGVRVTVCLPVRNENAEGEKK